MLRMQHGLVALLSLTAALHASKTWIVDANMGQGANFSNLQAAFNAAAPGDRVIVRPGTYSGATVKKGVSVLGQGTPTIRSGLTVQGLPPNQAFAMSGFRMVYARILVTDAMGVVTLESLTGPSSAAGLGVTATRSKLVIIDSCQLDSGGGATLQATSSTVVVVDSSVTGQSERRLKYGAIPGQVGASITGSTLVVVRGSITAGASTWTPLPGIQASNSRLTLGGSAVIATQTRSSTSAVVASGGSIVLHPAVTLVSSGNAAGISGSATVKKRSFSSATATGASPGGKLTVTVYGTQGLFCIPLLGAPVPPLATPYGDLWLHPAALLPLPGSALDATGKLTLQVPVPNVAELRGASVGVQSITTPVKNPSWELSTATAVVVH